MKEKHFSVLKILFRYLHCGGLPQSGVTHTGSSPGLLHVSLQWLPPVGYTGRVLLRAVVVANYTTFWSPVAAPVVEVWGEGPGGVVEGGSADVLEGRSVVVKGGSDLVMKGGSVVLADTVKGDKSGPGSEDDITQSSPVTEIAWRPVLMVSSPGRVSARPQYNVQPRWLTQEGERGGSSRTTTAATTLGDFTNHDRDNEDQETGERIQTEESQRWEQVISLSPPLFQVARGLPTLQDVTTTWRSVLLMPKSRKTKPPGNLKTPATTEESKQRQIDESHNSKKRKTKLPGKFKTAATTEESKQRQIDESHESKYDIQVDMEERSGKLKGNESYLEMEADFGSWGSKSLGSRLSFKSIFVCMFFMFSNI